MTNLSIGDEAVSFELPGVDGKTHSLSDYEGKAAIAVIFTCNHCPYARAWEDRIVSIQSDYGSTGLQVLAINANDANKYPDDGFLQMQQRAEDKGFNFPTCTTSRRKLLPPTVRSVPRRFFSWTATGSSPNFDDPDDVSEPYLTRRKYRCR